MRRTIVFIAGIALGGYLLWPYAFTVVPIDQASSFDEGFDPGAFVDGVWADIESAAQTEAVDMAALLGAIAPDAAGLVARDDLAAVTETDGLITAGEAHVFLVEVIGTVTSVDTESSVGTMTLAIDGYAGPIEVKVYIGPRIPSDDSSIRDSVGFIAFGDFRDQTEYGRVASEINRRVSGTLATVDADALEGRQITVHGAMTIRTFNVVQIDVSTVNVVPIAIELG